MASFFPGGQDSFTPKVDLVDTILATHVNDLQNAVASLEVGGVSKQNIAYAASITPNVPAGQYVIVGTLTGNITINAPTNALTGRQLTFRFTQDGTGGRTVTWNAVFKVTNWTVNTGANAVTEATFTYDGTNWFLALNPPVTTKVDGSSAVGVTGYVTDQGPAVFNMLAPKYLAIGTWTNGFTGDAAAAVTQAIADAAAGINARGASILFPPGDYIIRSSLVPTSNIEFLGVGGFSDTNAGTGRPATSISMVGANVPHFSTSGTVRGVKFQGLGLFGTGANAGSVGISAATANAWQIRDCFFHNFGDQAILISAGADNLLDNVWVQGSLLVRTGRAALVGCVDVASTDTFFNNITATASILVGEGTGNICGIVIRGTNSFGSSLVGHISQIGIGIPAATSNVRLVNCRADLNNGQGFEIDGGLNQLVNCTSFKNSRVADNTSSGFVLTNGGNTLVSCLSDNGTDVTTRMKNGIDDSNSNGSIPPNRYIGCDVRGIVGIPYNVTGSQHPIILDPANVAVQALAYGVTIATDAAQVEYGTITVTNGTAFTISNPTNLWNGKVLEYEILNSSGGAMGVITWGTTFKMPAFTNPGNGLRTTLRFRYNGTNLVQVGPQSAAF